MEVIRQSSGRRGTRAVRASALPEGPASFPATETAGPLLVWFKRDLRIDDHPGLHMAICSGRTIVGLFVLDRDLYEGMITSELDAQVLHGALAGLSDELKKRGIPLILRSGAKSCV